MQGTKWLSDAVKIEEITPGAMNVVVAPTGCGKTTFALNTLPKTVSNRNQILYLIDTINGREQLLTIENTAGCSDEWIEYVLHGNPRSFIGDVKLFEENKIVIMTYSKFGVLARRYEDFGYGFEWIVCDELHSGVEMQHFNEMDDHNNVKDALQRLRHIVTHTNVKVVGLTATPSKVRKEFGHLYREVPVDADVRRYEVMEEIHYSSLPALIYTLRKGAKGLIYTGHITQMKEVVRQANDRGLSAVAIWSIHNTTHSMSDEQMEARRHILTKWEMPQNYDVVVINKSCETSITINGQMDYIIIHSQDADRRQQVRGRYRGDIKKMYILDYDAEIVVPDEFMGRKLFKEDKDRLCALLNQKRDKAKVMWPTVSERLINEGYSITNGRQDNKRYSIITL